MQLIIHRGTRQIGGCVTEIRAASTSVFIDIGANLPGDGGADLPPIEGLTAGDGANNALFITHSHGDHIGLLDTVLPEVAVYMNETAKAVYRNLVERTAPDKLPLLEKIQTIEAFRRKQIGSVAVLPLISDHSAFGAYMFVIETEEVRVLHTGDFRLHGIVGKQLISRFIPRYAQNIDYIVCEGTTLSRNGTEPWSERKIQAKAAKMMTAAKYVFVLCSSTNFDRIGAFYHANPKERLFICDLYQKKQLETLRNSAGDNSYYNFKHIYSYAPNLDRLMKEKGFCMLVRQGEFFRRVMAQYKDDCLVIYAMWTGYLDDRAKNQALVDFLSPYRQRVLHTSGHASPSDLKRLYAAVNPKHGLIPIHTEAPEVFCELVDRVITLADGEVLKLAD